MFEALFVLIVVYISIGCFIWWIFSMLLEDFGSMSLGESEAYARVGAVVWPVAIPVVVIGGFGWAVFNCVYTFGGNLDIVIKHLRTVFSKE